MVFFLRWALNCSHRFVSIVKFFYFLLEINEIQETKFVNFSRENRRIVAFFGLSSSPALMVAVTISKRF